MAAIQVNDVLGCDPSLTSWPAQTEVMFDLCCLNLNKQQLKLKEFKDFSPTWDSVIFMGDVLVTTSVSTGIVGC